MKAFYLTLGILFFVVGAIGALVPGLPTTVFMLLALWAFARSSQRFHDWLYYHRVFGPPLQRWHRHHVISPRAKLLAVVTMACSLCYLLLFTETALWLKAGTTLLIAYAAWFILSKPSAPPVAE